MAETNLANTKMSDLRTLAKKYNIKAERTWNTDDFIAAISAAQAEAGDAPVTMDFVEDTDDEADGIIAQYSLSSNKMEAAASKGPPRPGHARIILHKDPTPHHANSPVQVGLNGRYLNVPRGVPVDVPIPYLGVLRDAVHLVRRQVSEPDAQNLDGVFVEEEILSYPFQIVSLTPGGKFVNTADQRSISASRRAKFHEEHKRWPTDGELNEWEKMLVRSKN